MLSKVPRKVVENQQSIKKTSKCAEKVALVLAGPALNFPARF